MNQRLRRSLCIGIGFGLVAAALAQQPERPASSDRKDAEEEPLRFFVSPGVLRNGLDRLVDEIDDKMSFDDEQYMAVRRIMQEKVPEFLREHHKQLNALANSYFEAYYDGEPPDSVFVAEFADNALPQLTEFNDLMHELAEEFRGVCNEDQIAMVDGYMAGFEVAVQAGHDRLKLWSEGYFDPETEWRGSPQFRPAEGARAQELEDKMVAASQLKIDEYRSRRAAAGAPGATGDQPAARAAAPGSAADAWDAYVKAFIARFQLDSEKQQRAWQYHARYAEDRDRYLRRKLDDMTAIEQMYADAAKLDTEEKADEATKLRERADTAMNEIESSVNEIFERLKEKLDTIPTRKQRREAAEREAAQANRE